MASKPSTTGVKGGFGKQGKIPPHGPTTKVPGPSAPKGKPAGK